MLLTSILVKVLAIADVLLGYFATSTAVANTNICGTNWVTYSGATTACGNDFIANLVALITGLTQLAPSLLEGLLAIDG